VTQQPSNQVIVTPLGVVPAAPAPAVPTDPQVAAVQAAEQQALAEAQTQPPPDRGMVLEILQGVYYVVSGLWPVVHASSYQHYTGGHDLTDLWLLRTLGAVLAVVGLSLLWAVRRRSVAPEAVIMAGGVAAVLAIMDMANIAVKAYPPIYCIDCLIQVGFLFGWITAVRSPTRGVHLITK
jgi:hypothetical protein